MGMPGPVARGKMRRTGFAASVHYGDSVGFADRRG